MKCRKLILSLIALSLAAALVACGSSHRPISVTLGGTPPASLVESATQSFTATVSNDSANAGVGWTVTCGSADCGGFSSTSTSSGTATTYTAPSKIPTGKSVTITATSVSDSTKFASATVTITSATTLADGTYVFSIAGQDTDDDLSPWGNPYYVAGAFTVAGGTITGGEQDFVDYNLLTLTDAITGGTVTTTADGNLQITLVTADTSIGVGGTETLDGRLVSGNKALLTEFDASASSSGSLELQTSTAAPGGGYAFFVTGFDTGACPASFGGVVNVDGSGTISGAGSVFDQGDCGFVLQAQPIDSGTVTAPDAFGRIQISLDLSTSGVGGIGLVGYIVDGNKVRLVENSSDPNDVFFGTTGGSAFAQGASTGNFNTASVSGSSSVFGTVGANPAGYLQVAGIVSFNADGTTATGTLNFNDLTGTGVQAPTAFTGTYTVDSTGRVTLSNLTDGATFSFNAQAYLDGNGHSTVISVDAGDVLGGLAYQQTGAGSFTASSFSGTYGMSTTGIALGPYTEFDTVGTATSDGVSAVTGTFDQNVLFGAQTAGLPLTDGFSAVDASGFLTGTMTGLDATTSTNQDAFTYYLIDTTKVVAIETDPNQLTLGYFELQQ